MPFRILSLDGGGIRGIVAATMLAAIEKEINQPLNKYFDLIAGTSTGSILAAAIASGRTSQEIVELYQQKSAIIFPNEKRSTLQQLAFILRYGLFGSKFSHEGLIKVLKEAFGETRLFDITSPRLLIVSYDTISREPIIFKSWRQDKGYGDVPLWEVCVCSTSAPTYFPPYQLDNRVNGKVQKVSTDSITLDEEASASGDIYNNLQIRITDGKGKGQTRSIKKYIGTTRQAQIESSWEVIPDNTSTYSIKGIYSAVDGGVAANNPASCALAEAIKLGHKIEEITMLSVGTGDPTRVIPFEQTRNWGLIQWAQPLIGMLFDGSGDVNEYITKQLISDRLFRLQFRLDRQLTGKHLSDDIDDVSQENLRNLVEAAEAYVQQPKIQAELQRFLVISH
jgi:uncharacterized protein